MFHYDIVIKVMEYFILRVWACKGRERMGEREGRDRGGEGGRKRERGEGIYINMDR